MTNILIVEDEQNLARFIELELTHENYTVDIENDGKVGLDKALSKPYDLYILDLMLPNINGLDKFVKKQLLQLSSLLRKARHMIK